MKSPSNLQKKSIEKNQKIEITFTFTKAIPLKINRIKKKVHQTIENAFNFRREIPIQKIYLQFYMRNPLQN